MPWAAWRESIEALTEEGRLAEAALTIERALNEGQDAADLLALLQDVEARMPVTGAEAPDGVRRLNLHGLRLKVRLLGNAQRPGEVIAFIRGAQAAGIQDGALSAYLAWALAQQETFAEALEAAEAALQDRDHLTDRELGLALRMKGFTMNRLNVQGDWAAAFDEALQVSSGWARGLVLLDLGGLHSRAGNEAGAMLAYAEALSLVKATAHRAMVLNNMALICLRSGRFEEAEEYFAQLAKLRSGYRSRALSGMAVARRALGEWARAEALYRQAAAQAGEDKDDLRQALRGLGHTLRLAGRHLQSLEPLRAAAQTTPGDVESGCSWVNVDLAATLVSLDQLDVSTVEGHLARTGPLDREDRERAVIVRAELARRTGNAREAVELLGAVQGAALWVREEALAFPQLFALLPAGQRPVPLPRPPQTQVHLRALGIPVVTVNGRRVRLGALEVVTLAALLLAGGDLTTDELTEVVRDGKPRGARQTAKRVSHVVRQLRRALGWPESVIALGGVYQLDPAARWTSDVHAALRTHGPIPGFLTGIPLPWATDQEQLLLLRDSDHLIAYPDS